MSVHNPVRIFINLLLSALLLLFWNVQSSAAIIIDKARGSINGATFVNPLSGTPINVSENPLTIFDTGSITSIISSGATASVTMSQNSSVLVLPNAVDISFISSIEYAAVSDSLTFWGINFLSAIDVWFSCESDIIYSLSGTATQSGVFPSNGVAAGIYRGTNQYIENIPIASLMGDGSIIGSANGVLTPDYFYIFKGVGDLGVSGLGGVDDASGEAHVSALLSLSVVPEASVAALFFLGVLLFVVFFALRRQRCTP